MSTTTLTYREVAETLEDFVERRGGQWDWDAYITATVFEDPYLRNVQQRMVHLSEEFPAQRGLGFCNVDGFAVIRAYIRELRAKAVELDQSEVPERS